MSQLQEGLVSNAISFFQGKATKVPSTPSTRPNSSTPDVAVQQGCSRAAVTVNAVASTSVPSRFVLTRNPYGIAPHIQVTSIAGPSAGPSSAHNGNTTPGSLLDPKRPPLPSLSAAPRLPPRSALCPSVGTPARASHHHTSNLQLEDYYRGYPDQPPPALVRSFWVNRRPRHNAPARPQNAVLAAGYIPTESLLDPNLRLPLRVINPDEDSESNPSSDEDSESPPPPDSLPINNKHPRRPLPAHIGDNAYRLGPKGALPGTSALHNIDADTGRPNLRNAGTLQPRKIRARPYRQASHDCLERRCISLTRRLHREIWEYEVRSDVNAGRFDLVWREFEPYPREERPSDYYRSEREEVDGDEEGRRGGGFLQRLKRVVTRDGLGEKK